MIRRVYSRKKKKSVVSTGLLAEKNIQRLHPMCMALLASEVSEKKQDSFINKSASIIMNEPHRLTDKWIDSLNRWTDERLKAISLPDPTYKELDRIEKFGLKVISIKPPNMSHSYPAKAVIALDDIGRKYYFKSQSKSMSSIETGNVLNIKATVKGIGEGITFLNRVSILEIKINI